MTMAQMLEQLFGRLGAEVGAKINATSFMNDDQSLKAMGDALEMMGLHRTGEEVMYSGITGKMFSSAVFMGPMHFMRLKHLAQDKINARGAGRREVRTHQPTGGRGNEGGMRIGEMERDVLLAHGITDFLQESMMKRSDGTAFWICNGCGTIPIVNEAEGLFVCPACDGPIDYQGVTAETISLVLPVGKSRTTFSKVEMPYALKLLDQELQTFMNAGFRFVTTKVARGFREPTASATVKETEEEAGLLQQVIGMMTGGPQAPGASGAPEVTEEAPADAEDEGQPARNEGPAVEPVAGQTTVDVDAKG
jgi:DNA-directed RNA polymerase II subunit RPB2